MSCSEFSPLLSELADSGLTGEAKARVEAHVASCAACRAALADMRRIRQEARGLPKMTPPEDLWNKVRARLDADQGGAPSAKVIPIQPRRGWFGGHKWAVLAAAAVLLISVSTGIVFMMRGSAPAPASQAAKTGVQQPGAPTTASAHAGDANLVQSIEMELQQADQHYEKALSGLEQVTKEGQGSLDPRTAAVLQKNLGILDQAIGESRAALKQQPTSELARTSLFEALQRKVQLLQDTVALINEMRKGNQAGAAQIVGGNKG
jgi:hypothetical protein